MDLMQFSTVFHGSQQDYQCFPFNQYSAQYSFHFPRHCLLSHITIVETMDTVREELILSQGLLSILGKNVGRAWKRTNDPMFSSLVH